MVYLQFNILIDLLHPILLVKGWYNTVIMVTSNLGATDCYNGAINEVLTIVHQEFYVWLVETKPYPLIKLKLPHHQGH